MRNLAARLVKCAEVFDAIHSPVAAELLRRASAAVAENRKNAALARELLLCATTRKIDHPEAAAIMREAAGAVSGE